MVYAVLARLICCRSIKKSNDTVVNNLLAPRYRERSRNRVKPAWLQARMFRFGRHHGLYKTPWKRYASQKTTEPLPKHLTGSVYHNWTNSETVEPTADTHCSNTNSGLWRARKSLLLELLQSKSYLLLDDTLCDNNRRLGGTIEGCGFVKGSSFRDRHPSLRSNARNISQATTWL